MSISLNVERAGSKKSLTISLLPLRRAFSNVVTVLLVFSIGPLRLKSALGVARSNIKRMISVRPWRMAMESGVYLFLFSKLTLTVRLWDSKWPGTLPVTATGLLKPRRVSTAPRDPFRAAMCSGVSLYCVSLASISAPLSNKDVTMLVTSTSPLATFSQRNSMESLLICFLYQVPAVGPVVAADPIEFSQWY